MIPNADFRKVPFLILSLLVFSCSYRALPLPEYSQFVAARQSTGSSAPLMEIYGSYSAGIGNQRARSRFSLLIDPGKRAYIEIVDPSEKLLYSLSLDQEEISLLWAQDGAYIREKAIPSNLNAIAGLALPPDDVLMLIAGQGLNFAEWQMTRRRKNGWNLTRSTFTAELTMKEEVSKIQFASSASVPLFVEYDDYQNINNKFVPTRIRFEVPARKMQIELRIEKSVPRDETPNPELFALQLPLNALRRTLKEIYRGKPLLME